MFIRVPPMEIPILTCYSLSKTQTGIRNDDGHTKATQFNSQEFASDLVKKAGIRQALPFSNLQNLSNIEEVNHFMNQGADGFRGYPFKI